MNGREDYRNVVMSNEQYRLELNKIFAEMQENYKLRWFYLFITEKIESEN